MKQVLQSLKNGTVEVANVPAPAVQAGHLLIASARSLISAGTERMLVDFGKAGFLGKARQQPEKVRMVLDKMRTDGILPTLEAVFNKLDQPLPMGYCNVGRVVDVGAGVSGFEVGTRVVSNGKHAEYVNVPVNLCAAIPDAVDDDEAAFTVIGAIALQGIRLVQPTLGETVVVSGLGLVGLLTVQLLRAHGCRVLGCDFDAARLALARQFGATTTNLGAGEDPVAAAQSFSRGRGVDAVLITASTSSNEPVHQAALMCRKRGRIVLIGVAGLELSRADFYEKELSFQVSCSYGPGRYDPTYEDRGVDYPVGFVRWTEQRNFEAVLDMLADGRVDAKPLVTHRYEIGDAPKAYDLVSGGEPSLGILLQYPGDAAKSPERRVAINPSAGQSVAAGSHATGLSVIGAGNYATAVLIPAFKAAGARLRSVASRAGVSGLHAGRKFGFEETTTDVDAALRDPETGAVVIATRHDTHAALACRALAAGKHVFVEKPLAMNLAELANIETAISSAVAKGFRPVVAVGFNRRFSPHVEKMKALLATTKEPKAFVMTVNAGAIPAEHWIQGDAGGGRIIGEACHFIDLLRFLADSRIESHSITRMDSRTGDSATITLTFADGSVGTILYYANGSKSFPKERLEVFARGAILQLDNFRRLRGFGWPGFKTLKSWRQDKGQVHLARAFLRSIEGDAPPIPLDELLEIARVTIELGK
jgi:predicted dehydrogenase/threonine dehydrogenase-like Zn-dependent dehydrogenase